MKKTFLSFFLLSSMFAHAQSGSFAVFGGVIRQPSLSGNRMGVDFGGRYYLTDNFSVGLQGSHAFKKYNEGFGYDTDRTKIDYTAINALVQFDSRVSRKFVIAPYVSTGANLSNLYDMNDIRIRETWREIFNGFYYYEEEEIPETLDRDVFYLLSPGVDFSYHLTTFDHSRANLYLTSRVGYRLAFGKGDFLTPRNITGAVFSLCIMIKVR